jgi:hypothetical protein
MMLGDVIAVESSAIVGFHNPQAIVVEILQRRAVGVDVIEDPEFHWPSPTIAQLSQDREGGVNCRHLVGGVSPKLFSGMTVSCL